MERALLPRPKELRSTHLDCLDFRELATSLTIARSQVCFGDMGAVNSVVKGVITSEGHDFTSANIASEKKKVLVQVVSDKDDGSNITSLEFENWMEINWLKISAGMDYSVSPEHRWLENLVGEYPGSFFCNHDSMDI